MASGTNVCGDRAIGRGGALSIFSRREALHPSCSLPCGSAGVLRPTVQLPTLAMFHTGQELARGSPVARRFVGDDHPRDTPRALQQLAEALLDGFPVTALFHPDVQDWPVPIHGTPEVVPSATNGEAHLIQVPPVSRSRSPAAEPGRRRLPNLRHQHRTASQVSTTPRSATNPPTSRWLKQKRLYNHTPWRMISAGTDGAYRRWVRAMGSHDEHDTWEGSREG